MKFITLLVPMLLVSLSVQSGGHTGGHGESKEDLIARAMSAGPTNMTKKCHYCRYGWTYCSARRK